MQIPICMVDVDAIRNNDFATYFTNRAKSIYDLIEKSTGKEVAGRENQNSDSIDETIIEEQEIYL